MSCKIAVLIDAENTSVKYIDVALKEMNQYGEVTVQRMYGDFSSQGMQEWAKKGLEYAIIPIHQARYTATKNASDIMLVIDAMDILYQGTTDTFCIISSDSDFTRLASRLREGGKKVIGMGLSNASKTFITACNEYKFLDKIIDEENELYEDSINEESAITPLNNIKNAINNMLQQAESSGKVFYMGSAKSQLQREFPDFDERNYGYSMFKTFIENELKLKVTINGSVAQIHRIKKDNRAEISKNVEALIIQRAKSGIGLGLLGSEIHRTYPDFSHKNLGYSKLSSYVKSIPRVNITGKGNKQSVHYTKNK